MAQDVVDLCDRLMAGDRRALARLLSLVEDGAPDVHRRILALLHPRRRGARLVGITGPPGVGKSSVTNALVGRLRAAGRRVAVLAIDPSSPLTGGALLGDRIRMQGHHADPDVFIRSMAARGHLGGLAAAAPEAALVLDAAGFDDVLIETVGVGQSEVDVMAVADVVLVVLAPGLGDSVQAAKAGVLEIADVLVVNKADQPGAGRLESELRTMLEVGHITDPTRDMADAPSVLRTVAVRDEGMAELLAAIDDRAARSSAAGDRGLRRARRWITELALGRLRRELAEPGGGLAGRLDGLVARVADGTLDPVTAADLLLAPTAVPGAAPAAPGAPGEGPAAG
jgi:LAO/AO transport system kinase